MTKRELDRLYKASRVNHGKYWGSSINTSNIYRGDNAIASMSPALFDRFAALLHNRLTAARFVKLKHSKTMDKYKKAAEMALAGPKGKLP